MGLPEKKQLKAEAKRAKKEAKAAAKRAKAEAEARSEAAEARAQAATREAAARTEEAAAERARADAAAARATAKTPAAPAAGDSPGVRFANLVRGALYLLLGTSLVIALILGQRGAIISLDDVIDSLFAARAGKVVLGLIAIALVIYGLKNLRVVR